MLKKTYWNRLEKINRELAQNNQEGIVLIGDIGDPISYKGRIYQSYEEFNRRFPTVRIIALGMMRETRAWIEERERKELHPNADIEPKRPDSYSTGKDDVK